MASKRKYRIESDSPGDFETPGEFTVGDAPNPEPDVAAAALTYVGPPYDKGIQLFGARELIRPAAFSQEQIAAFLEKHPDRCNWWR